MFLASVILISFTMFTVFTHIKVKERERQQIHEKSCLSCQCCARNYCLTLLKTFFVIILTLFLLVCCFANQFYVQFWHFEIKNSTFYWQFCIPPSTKAMNNDTFFHVSKNSRYSTLAYSLFIFFWCGLHVMIPSIKMHFNFEKYSKKYDESNDTNSFLAMILISIVFIPLWLFELDIDYLFNSYAVWLRYEFYLVYFALLFFICFGYVLIFLFVCLSVF